MNLHAHSYCVEVARVKAGPPQLLELRQQSLQFHTQARDLQRQLAGRLRLRTQARPWIAR